MSDEEPKIVEVWDAPGSAKDWEEFTKSRIGRWQRQWIQDSLNDAMRKMISEKDNRDHLAGGCEVLYTLLDMLDSIPQDKVESEREQAERPEETHDATGDSGSYSERTDPLSSHTPGE